MKKVQQFLDYAHTYSNTFLRFYGSDMQLMIHSDAAFLVLPKVHSRIAGYFRLAENPDNKKNIMVLFLLNVTHKEMLFHLRLNQKLKGFQNSKISIPIHHILITMGH